ncbi:hypothetical protein Pmar_PMAR008814, partial [Perkinsus marinus ATCC 50983]
MAAGFVKCEKQIAECNKNGPGKSPVSALCNQAVTTCDEVVLEPVAKAKISV